VLVAAPAQLALLYVYLLFHGAEAGVPFSGRLLTFLVFLVAPSLFVWLACWLIFRSRSVALKLLLALCALGIPVLLYSLLRLALQGFSH
jgi:hypothetical protein